LTGWSALIALGFIATALQSLRPFALLPMVYALWAYLGWLVYKRWYSFLDRQPSPVLSVGKALPEILLETPRGQRLSSLVLKRQPAIWIFFRGSWCPLCVAQIKSMAAVYRQINQQGVAIILVSGQSPKQTQRLARRFDVPFTFLRDPDLAAARELGLYHQNALPLGMQVLGHASDAYFPTVLITDDQGVIRFIDQSENYRQRPDPAVLLPYLGQLRTDPLNQAAEV